MHRNEYLLYHVNKEGRGIEIGPSYNPVAPKRNGYRTHIIDHLSRDELVKKYTGHPVKLNDIEEVDFVWKGQPYAELTGKLKYYDWIIASHVIEHTPDLIAFLNDCDQVLKDTGILSLAVPDKRYCYDHFRPITGLARVVDSHYQQNTHHTPGTLAENFLNAASRDGKITWDRNERGHFALIHPMATVRDMMERALHEDTYIDAHAWCFTPHSFRLMIHDLNGLGLISLKEVSFFPTGGGEFFVTLGRAGRGIGDERLGILRMVDDEDRASPR